MNIEIDAWTALWALGGIGEVGQVDIRDIPKERRVLSYQGLALDSLETMIRTV